MRWFLRFRVCIIVALAIILILAAISFSLVRSVLPYATGYKTEIETELSQQIGLPVHIEAIDADMHWFSPRLKLLEVSVFNAKNNVPVFYLDELLFELDTVKTVLRFEPTIGEISLVGIDLSVEKHPGNKWVVQGIEFEGNESDGLSEELLYTLQHADYSLLQSNIYYRDFTKAKLTLDLHDVNVNVENHLDHHTMELSMRLPTEYGESLRVITDLEGNPGDNVSGQFYIEGDGIVLKQWQKKFNLLPEYRFSGRLKTSIWGELKQNKPVEIMSEIKLENFVFSSTEKKTAAWSVDNLAGRIRVNSIYEEWRLTVSDLTMEKAGKSYWPVTSNIIAGYEKNDFFINADFLRLQDVARLVDIGNIDARTQVLKKYKITGDIYNLEFIYSKTRPETTVLKGDFADFGITVPEVPVVISGLDSNIHYDGNRFVVQLDSSETQLDLRPLFRQPLQADLLEGKATIELEGNLEDLQGWKLESPRLHMKNRHIDTYSRLLMYTASAGHYTKLIPARKTISEKAIDVDSSIDNEKPKQQAADKGLFIDMQTDFYDAYGKNASIYLPVGIMSNGLTEWIDHAVNDGYVEQGRFILFGTASGFPYADNSGVMEVVFGVKDASLEFLPEWPAIKDMSANIRFFNRSFYLDEGTGKSEKGFITNSTVNIDNMVHPEIRVAARITSSARDIKAYVRNSPLNDSIGNALSLFQMDGETVLDLSLDIPLYAQKVVPDYSGDLYFTHAGWYYPELQYALENINGKFHFTDDTVSAESVTARSNGKKVKVSAHTIHTASEHNVVFNVSGLFDVDRLLAFYDWIPQSWFSGFSPWDISVTVPYKASDFNVKINAASTLQGVHIRLSDAVSKPARQSLPTSIVIDVLDENVLHADITVKDALTLYAVKNSDKLVNFTVHSDYIAGKGSFAEGLDKNTDLKLDLDKLDLYAMLVSAENERSREKIKPVDFPPLDWKIKTLVWDDWVFNDVQLETNWHQHGMLINRLRLNGPAMRLDAKGTWLTSWRYRNETVLAGTLHSDNMGITLTKLGFEKSIDRSSLDAKFNTNWRAEPYSVSWQNVKGNIDFSLEDGEVLEVDPGAGGRLLGLMNVFKLTNRLALDFDDVYRKGFSFDTINGELVFADGEGSLKNFDVKAPAADINMFGNIGLVAHDYDLLMRVKPHADGITFAGGALLGGVVVGAGLALIQKVFDISLIGHDVYTITGSWDKPEIKKIIEKTDELEDEEDDF